MSTPTLQSGLEINVSNSDNGENPSKASAVIRSMRPPFLVLSPICVFLGVAMAMQLHQQINIQLLILVAIGATTAHISVNTFNEYFDFTNGLDNLTTKTPFSGGSGGLPDVPEALTGVLILAVGSLIVTVSIGMYIVSIVGLNLLWLGLAGVFLIVAYTRWINRLPLLCLVAPGFAFGPLFVVGTYLSISPVDAVTIESLLSVSFVSLVPFFLVNNLLLLNQLPDVQADTQVRRKTFPIVYGKTMSLYVFLLFNLAIGIVVLLGVVKGLLSPWSLITLVPLLLSIKIFMGLKTSHFDIEKMIPSLGQNVVLTLLTTFLLAATIFGVAV